MSTWSELQSLNWKVLEITIPSDSMNDQSITSLNLSRFQRLRKLTIGNECFMYVNDLSIQGMSMIESIVIGENSFTKKKNNAGNDPNRHFYLKNCERLRELRLGHHSFSDYSVCEIENVDRLEVIKMAELNEWSNSFYCASLELKCDYSVLVLINRFAQFEITFVW